MKKIINLASAVAVSLALQTTAVQAEPSQVDVLKPIGVQTHQRLSLTGTVEAIQHADLAPLQAGLVADIYVEQGDEVKQGQKLLQLDATLAQLTLSQTKAQLSAAELAYKEAVRLYEEVVSLSKKQLVAETTMAERASSRQVALANLTEAKAQLAYQKELVSRHTLYAPFNGVIANRNLDLGEWVSQQTSAFTLVQRDNLRLSLDVPQEYFSKLATPSQVAVRIMPDALASEVIEASVNRLVAVANNSSRTFKALVDLPENAQLMAGMSAQAEIMVPNTEEVTLWLPKAAIKQHPDGGRSIFTVEQGKANRVLVKVVEQGQGKVAVTGAPSGATIVVSGVELIRQGDELVTQLVDGEQL